MQRTKSSVFHKLFVVLLSAAAFFTCIAWLANFRFPLAVLQTVGLVDYARLDGVNWYWSMTLHEDEQRKSWVSLYVSMQVLSIRHGNYYLAKQPPVERLYVWFGVPIVYYRRGIDFRRPMGYQFNKGTQHNYQSFRYSNVDIDLWFLWPVLAAYPLWSLIRGPLTQLHRRKHGLCLNCGYSLEQLTEPRCPECGCEIESVASA